MADDWGSTMSTLAGIAVGGGFSYFVMRGQVAAERQQRKQDRLSEVIADYWAAVDRYAISSEEMYVLRQQMNEAERQGEPVQEYERQWAEGVARQEAAGSVCRALLGKVRIFFPELELCASELLLASGPGYGEEGRDEKLRAFEAAARESLGVVVRPGTEFFVPAGK